MRVRLAQDWEGFLTPSKISPFDHGHLVKMQPIARRSIAEALLEFGRQLCTAVSDAYHSRRSSSAAYRQAADGGRLDCSGQTSNQSVCWARSGRSGISAKIRLWRSLFAASICLDIRSNERSQQPRSNRSLVVSAVAIWRAAGVAPAVIAGRLVRDCEVRRGSAGVLQLSPPRFCNDPVVTGQQ